MEPRGCATVCAGRRARLADEITVFTFEFCIHDDTVVNRFYLYSDTLSFDHARPASRRTASSRSNFAFGIVRQLHGVGRYFLAGQSNRTRRLQHPHAAAHRNYRKHTEWRIFQSGRPNIRSAFVEFAFQPLGMTKLETSFRTIKNRWNALWVKGDTLRQASG